MKSASFYLEPFTWKRRRPNVNTELGSDDNTPNAWQNLGTLFGSLESNQGSLQDYNGVQDGVTTGTIRLRDYPSVSVRDRLVDQQFDEVWRITGMYRGDNEIVCQVERPERQSEFDD